ncbi:Membrane protein insertase YidC [subsurface metagenome]
MDKKTIIAVVLAVFVIIGSMIIQSVFFPTKEIPPAAETAEAEPEAATEIWTEAEEAPSIALSSERLLTAKEEDLKEESFILETEVYQVTLSNRGGIITSIQLKEFVNRDGTPLEMVLSKESGRYPFSIHFGDMNSPAVDELFHYQQALVGNKVEFSREFQSPAGVPFTLQKTYLFKPNDYLIELSITIENSVNDFPALDYNGIAYTLGFGPQIGPDFKKLDRRHEYRQYLYFSDGKKKNIKVPKEGISVLEERVTWAAIIGKYFEVIVIPDATQYRITYDTQPISGLHEQSSFYFSRPVIRSYKNTDIFRFYVGPKKRDILLRYNDPNRNEFKIGNMHFEETVASSVLIGWLANILKFFLELFYRVIPNYGVAIILLTILIKVLLFPLTRKSYESTGKMQSLQPKINELRERLKGNPQQLNKEMAALYKRERVNPMGGCLPMLLQLPIFFALYNLLSNHFELRGAAFLPPWIVDLSAPESVWDFSAFVPNGVPFVGWQDLRLLPFIMVVTTFLQSRLTQAPGSSNKQMKMMTYMMPIMFFFILYDMPSGLVLYWTMQNFISVFQQLLINERRRRKGGRESSGEGK